MADNEMMTFDEYSRSGSGIFKNLRHIREFAIVGRLPQMPLWDDDELATKVLFGIYERMAEVVRVAGVHYENELELAKEPGRLIVRYADDSFEFRLVCTREYVAITRPGSALSNFHEWYVKMMPSVYGLIDSVGSILQEHLDRPVLMSAALFRFNFLVYDLRRSGKRRSGKVTKNSEVMRKLLETYPDETGALTSTQSSMEMAMADMARTDVSTQRWIGDPGHRRLLLYSVEAPANRLWSSLWFTFEYGGETYTSPQSGEQRRSMRVIVSRNSRART